jgi:hypothetical protein
MSCEYCDRGVILLPKESTIDPNFERFNWGTAILHAILHELRSKPAEDPSPSGKEEAVR